MFEIAAILFAASAAGVLAVFALYPLLVLAASSIPRRRAPEPAPADFEPTVSLLVVARNAEGLVEAKLRNVRELAYPSHRVEVVFVSDGSRDGTSSRVGSTARPGVVLVDLPEHGGKARALDEGFRRTRGEIVVFSDVDALLAPDALRKLVRHFADPAIGGVCGRRAIGELGGGLSEAQRLYLALDGALKRAESRRGRVTSNDGKLYAIRRELVRAFPPGATDDLYMGLEVVRRGYRFVYEPDARASVPLPSRSAGHEIARRRRIVARSLRGIYLAREVLNPLRFGFFAFGLFVNKVLRRFLPVFLLGMLASSGVLASSLPWMRWILAGQLAFLAAVLLHPIVRRRATGLCYYFFLGNLGTLLGLVDFLRRRETVRWEPRKSG